MAKIQIETLQLPSKLPAFCQTTGVTSLTIVNELNAARHAVQEALQALEIDAAQEREGMLVPTATRRIGAVSCSLPGTGSI